MYVHRPPAHEACEVYGWEEAASTMPRRVYILESVLPFGEDSRHEFKGHRCLSVEELPKSSFIPGTLRRSKKAISRYVVVDVGQVQYPTSAAVWQQKMQNFNCTAY